MNAPEHFLVVGSGSIARRHMNNIRAAYPRATVDCISASGRELRPDELPEGVTACTSLAQALARRPALAIVASPAPLHAEQAATLLSAGLTVLVEKPLSDSLARLAAHAQPLHEYRDKLVVAYNLRFMPSAVVARQVIESGQLGAIHSVASEVGQYLPDWRPASDYRNNVSAQRALGGGVLLELSHELDYLQWLFGAMRSVYCQARTTGSLQLDVEDTVDALMTAERGTVINLHMDFLQRAPVRRCRVIAEHATLEWDILNNRVALHEGGGRTTLLHDDPGYDRNRMYVDELTHFVDVAQAQSTPFVTLEQGLETLKLVEALKRSSATGASVALKDL